MKKDILFETLTEVYYTDGTSETKQTKAVDINIESSFNKYGYIIEEEIQPGVYNVKYEKEGLYIKDMLEAEFGKFLDNFNLFALKITDPEIK